jgi:hypothetical protein
MKRTIVLALIATLTAGCAGQFGDGDPAQDPPENEENQGGAIRTFNGQLQRPADAVGTLSDQTTNAESTQIYQLLRGADRADVEIGAKYSRSTK